MLSSIMLLPRDARSAIKPQDNAPATADDKATRHAMFEKGISTVNNHV
jgi:hypothetical protein